MGEPTWRESVHDIPAWRGPEGILVHPFSPNPARFGKEIPKMLHASNVQAQYVRKYDFSRQTMNLSQTRLFHDDNLWYDISISTCIRVLTLSTGNIKTCSAAPALAPATRWPAWLRPSTPSVPLFSETAISDSNRLLRKSNPWLGAIKSAY